MPFQDLAVGSSSQKPVYDDAIMRAARVTTSARSAPSTVTRPKLSFGSFFPSTGATTSSGASLSFPKSVPTVSSQSSGNPFNFLSKLGGLSMGEPVGSSSSGSNVYDDAIMRAARSASATVAPIPSVHTAQQDGSSNALGLVGGMAKAIMSNMGSTGDGEVVPVSVVTSTGGSADMLGGINPLWIAGAAVGAGILYYVASK